MYEWLLPWKMFYKRINLSIENFVWRCKLFFKSSQIYKSFKVDKRRSTVLYKMSAIWFFFTKNEFILIIIVLKGILLLWWSKSIVQIIFQKRKRLKVTSHISKWQIWINLYSCFSFTKFRIETWRERKSVFS